MGPAKRGPDRSLRRKVRAIGKEVAISDGLMELPGLKAGLLIDF
jgi:hypothetical protein